MSSFIILLIGKSGSGKTSKLQEIINYAKSKNFITKGIISPGKFKNNIRDSFELLNIHNNEKKNLAKRGLTSDIKQGMFGFYEETITWGNKILKKINCEKTDLIIIDEIGPLELKKSGWWDGFYKLLLSQPKKIIITIRPNITSEIKKLIINYDFSILEINVGEYEKIYNLLNEN